MRSIKLKLVILYIILVFIVMIISGTFMLLRVRANESNKLLDKLDKAVHRAEEQVVSLSSADKFQDNLKVMANSDVQVSILDMKGNTLASTAYVSGETLPAFIDESISFAIAGTAYTHSGMALDTTNNTNRYWKNHAYPTTGFDGKTYILFARTDETPMRNMLLQIATTLVLSVLLALIMTAVFGFFFAKTITDPITALTRKSKEMAQGYLNQEITVYGNDEIGQLTKSFNFMAKELNRSMSDMNNEKNKMEIILHNMSDGILAYDLTYNTAPGEHGEDTATDPDSYGKWTLIHANFACRELLNLDEPESLSFGEMLAYMGLDMRNLPVFSQETVTGVTFSIGDRFISANFTAYRDAFGRFVGIIIVLQDVTKLTKLDILRKEFVANVSHEIRTPLSIIKNYTETLLDGALDERATASEFLEVIDSEADRMKLLVEDLLELSRFDNSQLSMNFEEIDLIAITQQCVRQNTALAGRKNQNISLNNSYDSFPATGDPFRINQVMTNIISNAVKYSSPGSELQIITEDTESYYCIHFQDNGMGIPKEDIGRIFERFYRVDKARSRAMGGTGLGLAIAKEIIEAHEGHILISSEIGKGTVVTLQFTKNNFCNLSNETQYTIE